MDHSLMFAFPSEEVELVIMHSFSLWQISGLFLDEGQVRCIVDEIKQVITASSARKQERAERAKAEDFDAEEGEMLEEENEQEEVVFGKVCFYS